MDKFFIYFKLKVLISFERYLSVRMKNWKSSYLNPKRAAILSVTLILAMMLLNLNIFFTFGVDIFVNGTELIQCFSSPLDPSSGWMDVWGTVKFFIHLYSFVIKKHYYAWTLAHIFFFERRRTFPNVNSHKRQHYFTFNFSKGR